MTGADARFWLLLLLAAVVILAVAEWLEGSSALLGGCLGIALSAFYCMGRDEGRRERAEADQ